MSRAGAFGDGVHFVDLAPIRDPALVTTAMRLLAARREAIDLPSYPSERRCEEWISADGCEALGDIAVAVA